MSEPGYKGGWFIGADDKTVAENALRRLRALQRRWEKSGHTDITALMGMVIFVVPDPLRGWLVECLQRLIPRGRLKAHYKQSVWMWVRQELKQNPNLTVEEAQRRVAEKLRLAKHPASSAGTVQGYWQEVEKALPPNRRHKRRHPRRL